MTHRLRARRGSALILVLLMTLAVAGLAVAAIFMSSSAGLLSRFYDRERDYRLAAESALEIVRSRLAADVTLAIPDTGMVQLAAGFKVPDAGGATTSPISVNVYAAVTGDTTATALPHVTLIAAAYDAGGTRHVRRFDMRRESLASYALFVDTFPSGAFGPGAVQGRAHSNHVWRSGSSAATAGVYRDALTAVSGFTGSGTYAGDTNSSARAVFFPRDSSFAWMTSLASGANLSIAPASGGIGGFVPGSRVEFVAVDVNADGHVAASEGFLRVFDLPSFRDTTLLRVGMPAYDLYVQGFGLQTSTRWTDEVIQNQCGAFYYRNSRWHFIPVATHRQSWFNNSSDGLLVGTGSANYPSVPNGQANNYRGYSYNTTRNILELPTARCFPPGSPFLVNTERFTNASCVQSGTVADIYPYGSAPSGCFPSGKYGGSDTTFTATVGRCLYDASGDCFETNLLGTWRDFPGGNAAADIPTSVRQAAELPKLWPLAAPRNSTAAGVVRITGGPIFLSGELAGRLTLVVDGQAEIIDALTYANGTGSDAEADCDDLLGVIATHDILVADNAISRARRISRTFFSNNHFIPEFGTARGQQVHGHLLSLTGTVGIANAAGAGLAGQECTGVSTTLSSGGCWYLVGGAAMRTFSSQTAGAGTGLHWAGTSPQCAVSERRPPFFPLTNRYTLDRVVEIEPAQANNPAKIRSLLMRLKGNAL